VPLIVREISDPLEAERILIESNRQRDKTPSEVMREADSLTRIFAEEARRRMLPGKAAAPVATLPQGSGGDHKTLHESCRSHRHETRFIPQDQERPRRR